MATGLLCLDGNPRRIEKQEIVSFTIADEIDDDLDGRGTQANDGDGTSDLMSGVLSSALTVITCNLSHCGPEHRWATTVFSWSSTLAWPLPPLGADGSSFSTKE